MRWHVYGTDAGTGQDVVLALDEQEATHAVQTAIAKRILVSPVTREVGEGLRRRLVPLAFAMLAVLAPLCAAVYLQNMSIRSRLDQAVSEQKRLAQIAAQAESLASQIRQGAPPVNPGKPLSEETSQQMVQLVEQLASARSRASQSEQQLSATYQQMRQLEQLAREVPQLRTRLQSESDALQHSASEVLRLGRENALQRRRMEELTSLPPTPDPIVRKLAQAEAANKELAGQVDLLKSQLLVAAASSTAPAAPEPEVATVAAAPARWAMRTGFETASEYLRIHFDKDTFRTVALSDGVIASSAAKPSNAATFRLLHDAAKERVFTGTLTVSLAPDGPRDKLAENQALVLQFLRTFAPSVDKPEDLMAAALAHITPKAGGLPGPGERWVLLADDCKLSVWHKGNGEYAFRAESPRGDLDP
jgi:hypothetical protein